MNKSMKNINCHKNKKDKKSNKQQRDNNHNSNERKSRPIRQLSYMKRPLLYDEEKGYH